MCLKQHYTCCVKYKLHFESSNGSLWGKHTEIKYRKCIYIIIYYIIIYYELQYVILIFLVLFKYYFNAETFLNFTC